MSDEQSGWGRPAYGSSDERQPDHDHDPGRFRQPAYGPAGYGYPGESQPDPYGGQPAYGQPGAYPGSGQPGGAFPGYGPPALPPGVAYASWGLRALAYLIDVLALFACITPGIVAIAVAASTANPEGTFTPAVAVAIVLLLAGLGLWFFNYCWTQGTRGQSWGKRVVGVHFVREYDLQPPGGGIGIAKYALRSAIGNATCGLYSLVTCLWPLWDEKNQTLDDKILHTLVVRLPR